MEVPKIMRQILPLLLPALLSGEARERPNILWITAEDMSPALGCYGDTFATTPNIDKLAKESVRYTHAFATNPICSPSRSCLITGVYSTTLGTQHLRSDFPIPDFIKGWPVFLREAGYHTTNNVKTDYNTGSSKRLISESWTENSATAHWRNRKDKDQPFFSIFNDMTSHQSRTMVWPYEKFQKEIQSRLPKELRHDPMKAIVPPYYPDTPVIRRTLARFHDCVTVMDRNTGRILRQLKEDGLEKDTIVFFYSDHGSGLPRHKRLTLDSGLHVPLIIRFPQKYQHLAPAKPGESTDRLVSFVDFPPTILSLLEMNIPDYMQGKAFLGKNADQPHTHIYAARDRVDEAYDFTRAVRGKRYLYVRNYIPHISHNQPSFYSDLGEIRDEITRIAKEENLNEAQLTYAGFKRPREALYDTVKDPQNLRNLINSDTPAHRKALTKLRQLHQKWQTDTRDQGFYPEEFIWENIRRNNTTPYEFAKSQGKFPSPGILKASELVGNPDVNLDQLLGLLGENNPLLQYWGLIALADGDLCETCFDDLRYTLGEEHPHYVRTSAAAILAKHDQPEGLTLLRKTLKDTDPDTVLRAARAIELLGTKARPAIPDMHAARDKWKAINEGSIPMFIWFSLETALHNLGEKVENAGL
jgi:N-sulfoglucosamine sulfohydrolase